MLRDPYLEILGVGGAVEMLAKVRGYHLAAALVFGVAGYLLSGLRPHVGLYISLYGEAFMLICAVPVLFGFSKVLAALHTAITVGWCLAFYKLLLVPFTRSVLGT